MYPEGGVEVYRVPVHRGVRSLTDHKTALRALPDVRFAGGALVDPPPKEAVLYAENLFIKFVDTADPDARLAVLRNVGLTVKNEVDYATNAHVVSAPEGNGAQLVLRVSFDFPFDKLRVRSG